MVKVLEAVPNFSEGRDQETIRALVDAISAHPVDVLDWSSDPDHNRSVVTYIGDPDGVLAASLAAAEVARDRIDLRTHQGVHPRVGALDVLPFVPLRDLDMADAVKVAHRAGAAIGGLGVPVYFYAHASDPPGRGLAELRRGGFEALAGGFPSGRTPDLPAGAAAPHPSAGATCVGARRVLLAWNVFVAGIDVAAAREIAAVIRERDGGFRGLRALGIHLAGQNRVQISMNLEDPDSTSPVTVYEAIEREVATRGGEALEIQVIGMIPDALVLPPAAGRLHLPDLEPARVLSHRVDQHVQGRLGVTTHTPDDS